MIDDAVVMVEQLHRVGEEHPAAGPAEVVSRSVQHLLPALVGSSLSTIVIFLPFGLLGGVAGAYFKVLATTMVVALVCSFFVAWLGLPVIYLLLSRSKPKPPTKAGGSEPAAGTDPGPERPAHHELPWVRAVIGHPAWSLAGIGLLVGVMWFVLPGWPPVSCRRWTKGPSCSTTTRRPAPASTKPTGCCARPSS